MSKNGSSEVLLAAGLFCCGVLANGAVLQVGPGKPYAAPCAAIAAAANGDTIEIEAGLYVGDVCAWNKNDLTIRGVNGRPHLDANGKYVQSKGLWVAGGRNLTVENIEFSGAVLPTNIGTNGAAIRAEATNWTVRNCYFHDNQDGILESNVAASNIVIENSEFARNGYSSGQSHNLYIGHAASLVFRYNYSHDSIVGHLLKTRAAVNMIAYNRLSGENGTSSYEIDVPNGGTTYIIGNIIQQSPTTQNSTIVAYMAEGPTPATNPGSDVYVVNNTIVNERPNGGTFVRVDPRATTPAMIVNNFFVGPGTGISATNPVAMNNVSITNAAAAGLRDYPNFDYRLTSTSPAVNAGTLPGIASNGTPLAPVAEYVHPTSSTARTTEEVIDAGAYEFHDSTAPVITPTVTGTMGTNGWYVSGVTVSWALSDPETGIASSSGCSSSTLSADTAGTTLMCTATNRAGLSSSKSVTVKIDKTAPVISGLPGKNCSLWPVNHKFTDVGTVAARDAMSGLVTGSFNVTGASSQPADPSAPDILIMPADAGAFDVQLRAERLGYDGDRIYTLTAAASDMAGNSANVTAVCVVPHDQRPPRAQEQTLP